MFVSERESVNMILLLINKNEERFVMERKMRRQDKLIGIGECMEVLETAEYGCLATADGKGEPYITPINFVYYNDALYFHCSNAKGHKLSNMEENDRVCFNVVDSVQLLPEKFSTKFRSVIVFGNINIVDDPDEKRSSISALAEKLSPEYREEGMKYINSAIDDIHMLRLDIDYITGKAAK